MAHPFDQKLLGCCVKAARLRLGDSQAKLARRLGMSRSRLSLIERGEEDIWLSEWLLLHRMAMKVFIRAESRAKSRFKPSKIHYKPAKR